MFGNKAPPPKQFAGADYPTVTDALISLYNKKVKPLEEANLFERFHSHSIYDSEFRAKPMVLLIGQYSTGKTTFIRFLTGKDFPGMHIGPEPTTEGFTCIMHGSEDAKYPGNIACSDTTKPFPALSSFGAGFLSKFQVSEIDAKLMQSVSLVDTPGILAGEKQTLGRQYDYVQVVKWFAERAAMILLLFDAHKVDISDEFKKVIMALQTHDEKVRLVINKSDMMQTDELMHVYGGVMWFLGKVFTTPEVKRSYISSFWEEPLKNRELERFMSKERAKLLEDLEALPSGMHARKVNEFVRRVRSLRVHLMILQHLRKSVPLLYAESHQQQTIDDLEHEFEKLARQHELPKADFPDAAQFRTVLREGGWSFSDLPKAQDEAIAALKQVLEEDIPHLLRHFARDVGGQQEAAPVNPDGVMKGWLPFKKNPQVKDFKRRFCVLEAGKLLIYKSPEMPIKYTFSLESSQATAKTSDPASYCMELANVTDMTDVGKKGKGPKTVTLLACAESNDGMSQWLRAFQVHCCTKEDLEVLKKMEQANAELARQTSMAATKAATPDSSDQPSSSDAPAED